MEDILDALSRCHIGLLTRSNMQISLLRNDNTNVMDAERWGNLFGVVNLWALMSQCSEQSR